jgi:hypothetical protein
MERNVNGILGGREFTGGSFNPKEFLSRGGFKTHPYLFKIFTSALPG